MAVRHVTRLALLLVAVTPSEPLLLARIPRHSTSFVRVNHRQRVASHPLAVSHSNSKRTRRERLLRELEAPLDPRQPDGEAIDDPAAPIALAACKAADDRKALHTSALRVSHLTSATSFFVSMCGRSKAQINAIVKNVEDELEEEFGRRPSRQGKAVSGWVCLDYDSVVVNVFSEAQREFYGIDKYWAAGQPLDLSGVLTASGPEAELAAAEEEDDDTDDWELDDWSLDDDEDDDDDDEAWSVGRQAVAAGAMAGAAEAVSEAVPFDFSADAVPILDDDDDDDMMVREYVAEDDDDEEYDDLTEDELRALEAELDAELEAAERAAAGAGAASVGYDGGVDAFGGGDDDDDLFGEFAGGDVTDADEVAEVAVMTAEEEEAAELAALAEGSDDVGVGFGGDEDDGADWALGDERLRQIVESAERSASGDAKASGDGAGGWRAMMEEDGWTEESLEAELRAELAEEEQDDDDE